MVASSSAASHGDVLRRCVLRQAQLAGARSVCRATRCRDWAADRGVPYAEHVVRCNDRGLRFHVRVGAVVLGLVPGYRPVDRANEGNRFLIEYVVGGSGRKTATWREASAANGIAAQSELSVALGLPTPTKSHLQSSKVLPLAVALLSEVLQVVRCVIEVEEPIGPDNPLMEAGLDLHLLHKVAEVGAARHTAHHTTGFKRVTGSPPLHTARCTGHTRHTLPAHR